MRVEKKCVVCERVFRTDNPEKTTCSNRCENIRTGKLKIKVCPICGKVFKTGKDKVACGYKCEKELKPYHTCKECGKVFKESKLHKEFCSYDCKEKFKAKQRNVVYCEQCGKPFIQTNTAHRFCSQKCCLTAYYYRVTKRKRQGLL